MESMARPCQHPVVGQVDPNVVATPTSLYATRHNPFVYFQAITGSSSSCAGRRRPAHASCPGRPGHGVHHPQLQLHHPEPVRRRPRRHLRRRRAGRLRRDQHLPPGLGTEDPGLARLQEGRPPPHHLRRSRSARRRWWTATSCCDEPPSISAQDTQSAHGRVEGGPRRRPHRAAGHVALHVAPGSTTATPLQPLLQCCAAVPRTSSACPIWPRRRRRAWPPSVPTSSPGPPRLSER